MDWNEESQSAEEMIGSQLLDSLDLDFDTLARGQQVTKNMKRARKQEQKKQLEQVDETESEIKELIGYESILISIDERKNENSSKKDKERAENKQNSDEKDKNSKTQKGRKSEKDEKPANEGQAFNLLKNKK